MIECGALPVRRIVAERAILRQPQGRVVGIGSYEMFRDRIAAGFGESQHSKLLSNIFNWLVSDKRYQLRTSNKVPVPVSAGGVFAQQEYAAKGQQKTRLCPVPEWAGKIEEHEHNLTRHPNPAAFDELASHTR